MAPEQSLHEAQGELLAVARRVVGHVLAGAADVVLHDW